MGVLHLRPPGLGRAAVWLPPLVSVLLLDGILLVPVSVLGRVHERVPRTMDAEGGPRPEPLAP